jgi:mRNA interferase RelE/StbE
MIYNLQFHPLALKEWEKLDASVRAQFKKKRKRPLSAVLSAVEN